MQLLEYKIINMLRTLLVLVNVIIVQNEAARILAVFPIPSISHQVVFRPLTQELAKRGHEVVVITTDPVFEKGKSTPNFTEIDVHDLSYEVWKKNFLADDVTQGNKADLITQISVALRTMTNVFEMQLATAEVKSIINDESRTFDLLILEACALPALGLSHVFKIPVIQISSFGAFAHNLPGVGAPSHPLIHPTSIRQRVYNLTVWEKIVELYYQLKFEYTLADGEEYGNKMLKRVLGPDTPTLNKLRDNVDMLFLNVHPVWEINRPFPPNVIFMGGLHQKLEKELPKDLKAYLDSSKKGVIYLSFGTNIEPSFLPPNRLQALINVFSKLPYDILWKWNKDELPGRSNNIKISKWVPQSDLLRHPKIKLFITQGGLQSTDEALTAGVPLIGIPMLGDQWFNVEQYVFHKIGVHLDMETINEDKILAAINEINDNESEYRKNIVRLRSIMRDQPETPLERAVWWTEYVLRHGGAKHLRSPAANMSWTEYYEIELVLYVTTLLFLSAISLAFAIRYLCALVFGGNLSRKIKFN